jgi:hypothetical protein
MLLFLLLCTMLLVVLLLLMLLLLLLQLPELLSPTGHAFIVTVTENKPQGRVSCLCWCVMQLLIDVLVEPEGPDGR